MEYAWQEAMMVFALGQHPAVRMKSKQEDILSNCIMLSSEQVRWSVGQQGDEAQGENKFLPGYNLVESC